MAQIVGMDHMGHSSLTPAALPWAFSLLPVYFILEQKVKQTTPAEYDNQALLMWEPVTGIVLFAASSLQQAGLLYTTAVNSGFITGFYLILVPILGILLGHST